MIDGRLTERQTRPDGAMLRYLLTRADRIADDFSRSAQPAKRAEFHLDELVDCLDPERATAQETREETELLRTIEGDTRNHPYTRQRAPVPGPRGYGSDEEALDALMNYKTIMATPPDEIAIDDIALEMIGEWTDDQWLRAERSGMLDRIGFFDDEQDRKEAGKRGDKDAESM